MKSRNQDGFGAVGVLVVIVVLGVVGFAGWRAYDLKSSKQTKMISSVDNTSQRSSSNEVSSKDNKKPDNVYKLDSIGVTFSYPSDWTELFKYPNGVALKSSDFQSEQGFRKISNGSTLTVTATSWGNEKETLTTLASLQANGQSTASKFITVAGQNAIEFTHSAGTDRNQHLVVLFVKDGKQYIIEQQFKLDGQNPYPSLMDSVVASFKFIN